MRKAEIKPIEVEFITFDEFVEYGKQNTTNIVNGMPWSFTFNGIGVTHETDDRYLLPFANGDANTLNFYRGEVLVLREDGHMFTLPEEDFKKAYDIWDSWDSEIEEFTYNIKGCSRCGQEHIAMVAKRYSIAGQISPDGWNYWATCPTTGEPVQVRRKKTLQA